MIDPLWVCADDPQIWDIYVTSVCQSWYETGTEWEQQGVSGEGILYLGIWQQCTQMITGL